jgi:hypothetical protein
MLYGAIRLRREISFEWCLALGGVASVAFGIVLLLRPIECCGRTLGHRLVFHCLGCNADARRTEHWDENAPHARGVTP